MGAAYIDFSDTATFARIECKCALVGWRRFPISLVAANCLLAIVAQWRLSAVGRTRGVQMTGLTKYFAAFLLCFPSGALTQHVPDLSPYAVGLMPDVLIDELLVTCRGQKPPDWLTRDECERLSKERERRLQSSSQPRPKAQ